MILPKLALLINHVLDPFTVIARLLGVGHFLDRKPTATCAFKNDSRPIIKVRALTSALFHLYLWLNLNFVALDFFPLAHTTIVNHVLGQSTHLTGNNRIAC